MEVEVVCFPDPLGCFNLPGSGSSPLPEIADEYAFSEEFVRRAESVATSFRTADPEGCFLCAADSLGDEDEL